MKVTVFRARDSATYRLHGSRSLLRSAMITVLFEALHQEGREAMRLSLRRPVRRRLQPAVVVQHHPPAQDSTR
jgi:hypothetical protein